MQEIHFDPIRLEVFKNLFAAIAEEMGVVLRRSSYSPNIKERRDFSCAIFNSKGEMISQAAHIPVHLGSMPLSVAVAIQAFMHEEQTGERNLMPGDMVLLNDPYHGGTHLPDITLVTPVFMPEEGGISQLCGFVASRAHHADVGGLAPGSMTIAQEIYQEGLIIPPIKIVQAGEVNRELLDLILANVRTPRERLGDLHAQIAANQRGAKRYIELIQRYGIEETSRAMQALLVYSEQMTRRLLEQIPDGRYEFSDYLDDDGLSQEMIPIKVEIAIQGDHARIDFTGSAPQVAGSINAVYAITLSAVFYTFRCLMDQDIPNNSGILAPIEVNAPPGSVVNAQPPAAVAGGNVETSQRIVDVLLGALAQALPKKVPAASQGTMNNVSIGGWDPLRNAPFAYYETIGGGMGARPGANGASGVHSHMTNTLNTPVEALEYAYPLRVLRYEIRRGSGGVGKWHGGDGIRRDIQILTEAQISIISERRRLAPYGLSGGQPGACGINLLIHDGEERILPGKTTFKAFSGDILSIRTPGGGGYGSPST